MDPLAHLALAQAYVNDNLVALCEEQLQLQTGKKLGRELPHLRELHELCALAGHNNMRMAEGLIATAAMSRIATVRYTL
jgi:hypothetical protein